MFCIPTFKDARDAVKSDSASALDEFVYEFEPVDGSQDAAKFRKLLTSLVMDAVNDEKTAIGASRLTQPDYDSPQTLVGHEVIIETVPAYETPAAKDEVGVVCAYWKNAQLSNGIYHVYVARWGRIVCADVVELQ